MFDWVKYEDTCTTCGADLDEKCFQTKSAGCNLDVLEPKDVDYFSGWCHRCNNRQDYKVNRVCIVDKIERIEYE